MRTCPFPAFQRLYDGDADGGEHAGGRSAEGTADEPAALTEAAALAMLPQLLPPEVLAGLKMNINRPFGNGRDDNATTRRRGRPVHGAPPPHEPTNGAAGQRATATCPFR